MVLLVSAAGAGDAGRRIASDPVLVARAFRPVLGNSSGFQSAQYRALEFLLGKQVPYVILAMLNFLVLLLMAGFVFGVPLKGSLPVLALGALVYVTATTAYGCVISAFTRTQIAALFGTAILTVLPATMFSGMMVPVSSLTGLGAVLGRFFPMSYFVPISVGTFTKGLGFADLAGHLLLLSLFIPALTLISLMLVRPQEK